MFDVDASPGTLGDPRVARSQSVPVDRLWDGRARSMLRAGGLGAHRSRSTNPVSYALVPCMSPRSSSSIREEAKSGGIVTVVSPWVG